MDKEFNIVVGDSKFNVFPMDHRPVFGLMMMQESLRYFCGMSMELDQAKELYEKLGAWIKEYESVLFKDNS